ncbi:zinc finger protein 454-like [Zootermopsis nevadensis]|uniref:zinc finger protein 454-like n=1 Tax=Zootermopsis nevadensis TaxID=136037 RepID=UPI000B8E605B|nr:zinc finger protein 454-like [Zootermopsis nevadensis]
MGSDSECEETSREVVDTGTAAKIAKENATETNEKQTVEGEAYPNEECKQPIHRCMITGCEKAYSTEQELFHHEVTCCKESNFTCDTCKESFKKKSMLRIHMYLHQELSKRKKFSCPYDCCPKFYYVKASLTYHIKSVHEGKKFECIYPDCGKKLSTKASFYHHMMVHERKEFLPHETVYSVMPEVMCDTCKRNFKTKRGLEKHISDHQDMPEKNPFIYNNYKEHLTSEKDTQRHKRVFKKKSNLRRHLLIHKKVSDRMFCPHSNCSKSYANKRNLLCHMKCAHKENKCKSTYIDHCRKLASKVVAAPQASAKERKQMQDTENLPLLLTVASEKLKQMNEVVQTQGKDFREHNSEEVESRTDKLQKSLKVYRDVEMELARYKVLHEEKEGYCATKAG